MFSFDASAIIYAWDNYPIKQFPKLWSYLGSECQTAELTMLCIAFAETEKKTPNCAHWLSQNSITLAPVTTPIAQDALMIKARLGIQNDHYSNKGGVGENDILIIAATKHHRQTLVTDEANQHYLPNNKAHYKIPALCRETYVDVPCINFIRFIRQTNRVF